MPQRTQSKNRTGAAIGTRQALVAADSIASLAAQMPPVVYFVRVPGLIKIGHTTNLHNRTRQLGATMKDILAFVPGTRDDEASMHTRFAEHMARPDEWFHPHAEIFDVINEIRAGWGIDPIYA